jgi:hypothetical protein
MFAIVGDNYRYEAAAVGATRAQVNSSRACCPCTLRHHRRIVHTDARSLALFPPAMLCSQVRQEIREDMERADQLDSAHTAAVYKARLSENAFTDMMAGCLHMPVATRVLRRRLCGVRSSASPGLCGRWLLCCGVNVRVGARVMLSGKPAHTHLHRGRSAEFHYGSPQGHGIGSMHAHAPAGSGVSSAALGHGPPDSAAGPLGQRNSTLPGEAPSSSTAAGNNAHSDSPQSGGAVGSGLPTPSGAVSTGVADWGHARRRHSRHSGVKPRQAASHFNHASQAGDTPTRSNAADTLSHAGGAQAGLIAAASGADRLAHGVTPPGDGIALVPLSSPVAESSNPLVPGVSPPAVPHSHP